MGGHSHLQGIFPTQGSSPGLLHGRRILHCVPLLSAHQTPRPALPESGGRLLGAGYAGTSPGLAAAPPRCLALRARTRAGITPGPLWPHGRRVRARSQPRVGGLLREHTSSHRHCPHGLSAGPLGVRSWCGHRAPAPQDRSWWADPVTTWPSLALPSMQCPHPHLSWPPWLFLPSSENSVSSRCGGGCRDRGASAGGSRVGGSTWRDGVAPGPGPHRPSEGAHSWSRVEWCSLGGLRCPEPRVSTAPSPQPVSSGPRQVLLGSQRPLRVAVEGGGGAESAGRGDGKAETQRPGPDPGGISGAASVPVAP